MVGVLGLRPPPSGLSLDQRQLLDAFADQVAIAIERTRIDVVLEEQAKTEAILEASEDGLIVLDPSGTIEHVNGVACAILEVKRATPCTPSSTTSRDPSALSPLARGVREILTHPEHGRDRWNHALPARSRSSPHLRPRQPCARREPRRPHPHAPGRHLSARSGAPPRESRRHVVARAPHPAHVAPHGGRAATTRYRRHARATPAPRHRP
jgi:hypothetical protein